MDAMLAYPGIIWPLVVGAVLFACVHLSGIGRRPADFPPGPPTLPLLGNIHLMPPRDIHKQFQQWAQQYGPVYSLILGTQTMVVLSSAEAVKELLDKRSNIYSSRQNLYVGSTLCSQGMRMLMMPYGPTLRMIRKMYHQLLNINAAKSYVSYQMLENQQMLNDMVDDPSHFLEHLQRYTMSLTTSMVYGWRTPTFETEDAQQLFEGFEKFTVLNQTGAAALIDCFPVLRHLPGWLLPVKNHARELHKKEKKLYLKHWLNCKKTIQNGTSRPCFGVNMAKVQEQEKFGDELAAYVCGCLLEAGSDTSSSTLYGFIQAMVLFPDIQRRAQAEIDRVIGPDRLPNLDDEPSLQYIRGCVKETLRWMPTAILGFPHAVTQEDNYMGYRIPSGAGVVSNVYTINMDPSRYPDPRTFDPERYKDDFQTASEAASTRNVDERDHFTFGAGRRICQGMHIADRSLFLGISRMLWTFDFAPAEDEQGRPVLPDPEKLTQGFVCRPEDFAAKIIPRSVQRAEMVRREWKEAKETLLDPDTLQWS